MNANPEVLAGTSGLLDIEKTKNATHRYPALSDSSTEFHQPNETHWGGPIAGCHPLDPGLPAAQRRRAK
jgi:hypothetical protein